MIYLAPEIRPRASCILGGHSTLSLPNLSTSLSVTEGVCDRDVGSSCHLVTFLSFPRENQHLLFLNIQIINFLEGCDVAQLVECVSNMH